MKRFLFALIAGLAAAGPVAAQPTITSFDQSGLLTWTNFVTNAIYRVEWGPAPSGPWQSFQGLTNLSSIVATGRTMTVQVPLLGAAQFCRVVWTNAPPYAGLYDVQEYDTNDILVAAGRLCLAGEPGSVDIVGTRDLQRLGADTGRLGPQTGPGAVAGGYAGATNAGMWLNLNPDFVDNNVSFSGFLAGSTFLGSWEWSGFAGPMARGTFTALRQNASKPALAEPRGVWQYLAWDFYGPGTTGQLAFATATNPLQGQWVFGSMNPSEPGGHLLGQGQFTNANVSGNTISIDLQTAQGLFSLQGEMSGDIYAGFAQWTGTNRSPKAVFSAVRSTSP